MGGGEGALFHFLVHVLLAPRQSTQEQEPWSLPVPKPWPGVAVAARALSPCQRGRLWCLGGQCGHPVGSAHVLTELPGDLSLSIVLLWFLSHVCFKEIESMCVWINCLTPKNVVL